MRRELPGGYELDDDRGRVDVEAVHRYLSEEAYWVRGRDRATIERLVRESTRVIGAYHGEEQVGFARVISDGSSMAWLGDVFVLEEHRGNGLGKELVREAVDDPNHRDLYWYLNTRDAHALLREVRVRGARRWNDGPIPTPLITRKEDPPVGRCPGAPGRGPSPPPPNRGVRP
jgi:GNAT superfamily N-acetyltransferase